MWRLAQSPRTGPMIRESAMTPLLTVAPMPSSRPGGTPNRGSRRLQPPLPGTRSPAPRSTSAARSGESRADTIAEVAPRRRCIARSCWGSASWHATSIARSPKSRSALPCSMSTPRSAYPSQSPRDKYAWGKGKFGLHALCATKPSLLFRARRWVEHPLSDGDVGNSEYGPASCG